MKRWLVAIIGLTIVGILIASVVGFSAWQGLFEPANRTATTPILVRVESGTSVTTVISQLDQKKLIRSPFWLKVAARLSRAIPRVGLYHIQANESALSILGTIVSGKVAETQVTFPEGWRREEIGERLIEKGLVVDQPAWFGATENVDMYPTLVSSVHPPAGMGLEGFLFPDTYRFEAGGDVNAIAAKMVDNFVKRTSTLSLTYDTVILASIVEREAKFDEDRPLIAGVYANRLKLGMALEANPTVEYAKGTLVCSTDHLQCEAKGWWQELSGGESKSIQSPFNTYLHIGLPPGPICNPGLASVKAAASPTEHDDLYFVTDHDGHAHFAKTLAEHQQNVTKYLR